MKVDFSMVLTDLLGKPVLWGRSSDDHATLKHISVNALTDTLPSEVSGRAQVSGEEKFKKFKLASKISDADGPVDLKSEEISLLKKLIGELYAPVIVGRAWDMLEGNDASS